MTIVRYRDNPVRSIFDELDSMISSGFDMVGRRVGNSFPPVDIIEDKDGYRISADLPGMNKEDISINIENNLLTISGEKKTETEKSEKDLYYHLERSFGSFSRSFTLPDNVDTQNVEANFRNGVLTMLLKKREETKPRQIAIKVE
jgi:HSP20 family protein